MSTLSFRILIYEKILPLFFGCVSIISFWFLYKTGDIELNNIGSIAFLFVVLGFLARKEIEMRKISYNKAIYLIAGIVIHGLIYVHITIYLKQGLAFMIFLHSAILFVISSVFFDMSDIKEKVRKLEK